jgi:citrate lyase subunit beta/citryl-CoA lyase
MMRSMLFVPASRPDMIAKALNSAADAVCIDLEDSVAPADKAGARQNAALSWNRHAQAVRPAPLVRIFRINALNTHFAYRDLTEVVEAAGAHIDLVMLPKADSPRDVQFVDTLLTQIESAQGFARPIGIQAQIETAAGFLSVREIAQSSPRLEALIFGPGDFAASMRMPMANIGEFDANDDLYPGHRWHAAMQTIVAAARANGLQCLDGPYAGYKDAAGFERSCRIARAMGFDGKQCIHPAQLAVVNAVFSPTPEEIAQARRVVDACERAAAEGRGSASLDGRMIDAANIRMARVTLEQAAALNEEPQ